jgi:hypothetical protein
LDAGRLARDWPIAPIDERLAFLVADDRKAKPARFDFGRKLVELIIGEYRTGKGHRR